MHRSLAVLSGITDVARVRPDDLWKTRFQRRNHLARILNAQGRLCDVGNFRRVLNLKLLDIFGIGNDMQATVDLPARAFHFGMARMPNQHDIIAKTSVTLALVVDFRHQRTGGVDDVQFAGGGRLFHIAGNTMRTENRDGPQRNLIDFANKNSAAFAQLIDDVGIVNDLVAHIDRGTVEIDCTLDNINGANDARAEPAWFRKEHCERRQQGDRCSSFGIWV